MLGARACEAADGNGREDRLAVLREVRVAQSEMHAAHPSPFDCLSQQAGRPSVQGGSTGNHQEEVAVGEMHDLARCGEEGFTLIQVASAQSVERWEAARRRHHAFGSRAKPGFADGSREAIDASRGHTIVCGAPACGALVHLQVARRHARAAKRLHLADGDGCASQVCSRSHRPKRYATRQAQMARALLACERVLVKRPRTVAARVDLWAWSRETAQVKALAVLACA